jgi:hypothetical protein
MRSVMLRLSLNFENIQCCIQIQSHRIDRAGTLQSGKQGPLSFQHGRFVPSKSKTRRLIQKCADHQRALLRQGSK